MTDAQAARERQLVRVMQSSLAPGRVAIREDGTEEMWLVGESVALEGTYPGTQLVVRFRLVGDPGVLYGWRHPVWADPDDDDWTLLFTHFDEAAQTRTGGGYDADADGTVWLPNFFDSF